MSSFKPSLKSGRWPDSDSAFGFLFLFHSAFGFFLPQDISWVKWLPQCWAPGAWRCWAACPGAVQRPSSWASSPCFTSSTTWSSWIIGVCWALRPSAPGLRWGGRWKKVEKSAPSLASGFYRSFAKGGTSEGANVILLTSLVPGVSIPQELWASLRSGMLTPPTACGRMDKPAHGELKRVWKNPHFTALLSYFQSVVVHLSSAFNSEYYLLFPCFHLPNLFFVSIIHTMTTKMALGCNEFIP